MQRWMHMPDVGMVSVSEVVRMSMAGMALVMLLFVRRPAHTAILLARRRWRSLPVHLLGSLTPALPEWIDAPAHGCDHETSLPFDLC